MPDDFLDIQLDYTGKYKPVPNATLASAHYFVNQPKRASTPGECSRLVCKVVQGIVIDTQEVIATTVPHLHFLENSCVVGLLMPDLYMLGLT